MPMHVVPKRSNDNGTFAAGAAPAPAPAAASKPGLGSLLLIGAAGFVAWTLYKQNAKAERLEAALERSEARAAAAATPPQFAAPMHPGFYTHPFARY